MPSQRIAVAMSGGVDSSVAAAMLAEQRHDVFGLMMRLWSADPHGANRCCSPEDMALARQVAAQLQIPFYVIDAQEAFKKHVVDPFVNGYAQGITPNPCINCNRHIRWQFLLRHALAMGATHLATGHYAQKRLTDGRYRIFRAKDRSKDQSYVLSVLGQDQLSHALFPLGDFTKAEVRRVARRLRLPVSERAESQDLCFVGSHGDYRAFLQSQGVTLPPPGPIVDLHGNVLGQHQGLANYTLGQRKGIGVSASSPLYVHAKDLRTNTLVVGPNPALSHDSFHANQVNWVIGSPPSEPIHATVRVRYQAPETSTVVIPLSGDRAEIKPITPVIGVTPGQAAVFYQDQECLGGGIIQP
ncbi:MAG: tRNA 2-thiouridine(34) synthase MnmA [Anaerolineales bacterium]|jgi:tRNA-specific 2-thiouridylase